MSGAQQIPNGEQTFLDSNGDPLSLGFVYMYVPGTSTPANTWLDPNEITLNTNPVRLDAAGRAIIWGSGQYRQVVLDQNGVLQWDQLVNAPALGTLASQDASNVNITGGSITGITNFGSSNVNITGGMISGTTIQGVWTNNQKTISGNYTVAAADISTTLLLTGGFYQIQFNAAASYNPAFFVFLMNNSPRGKLIAINGSSFMLWPNQTVIVLSASNQFQVFGQSRWVLPGSIQLYASPTGVASNDGLGTDAPIDLQTAINLVTRGGFQGISTGIDCNNLLVTINLLNGTYNGQFNIFGGIIGADVFIIQSLSGIASNVLIQASGTAVAIFARDGGIVELNNVELACGSGGACIRASQNAVVDLSGVIFGSSTGGNMVNVMQGGYVNFSTGATINGNASSWLFVEDGFVDLAGQAFSFPSPVSFTNLIGIISGGVKSLAGTPTFINPGNVSGVSYSVTANGVLNRNGGVIPGSTGSTSSGGQVI